VSLDDALLQAHGRHDLPNLVTLYQAASETAQELDAKAFYLTQAYVYALDCGAPQADELHGALRALGREA
jgi:hypothetical protein